MRNLLFALAASAGLLGLSAPAHAGDGFPGNIKIGKNAAKWEVRGGIAAYDSGVFSKQTLDGVVLNAEILAPSPDFLAGIGAPRPYVGADIALSDDPIDVFYAGLNWEAYLTKRFYVGFSFGGSINTDDAVRNAAGDEKDLGSHLLFHLQASAGFDVTQNLTAQVYYNHFSNAGFARANNGLESVGARLGWRF